MIAPHGPKWWVSRKSQLGRLTVVAREPPMQRGRAWWTEPPKTVPDLEHIEYAIAYMREIQALPGNAERHILIAHVSDWIRRARQLSHEEFGAYVARLTRSERGRRGSRRPFRYLLDNVESGDLGVAWAAGRVSLRAWKRTT